MDAIRKVRYLEQEGPVHQQLQENQTDVRRSRRSSSIESIKDIIDRMKVLDNLGTASLGFRVAPPPTPHQSKPVQNHRITSSGGKK